MPKRKIISKYNPETHKWEEMNNMSKTVVEYDGQDIYSSKVYTDAPLDVYEEEDRQDVTTALVRMDEKLKRHDGYISYLALHGGGGSGGGGGASYEFGVKYLNITDGTYTTTGDSATIMFQITGAKSSMYFNYRIIYDGQAQSDTYTKIKGGTIIEAKVPNIEKYSDATKHTFTLDVLDPYNFSVDCDTIYIIKSSVNISADKQQTITYGQNGVVKVNLTNKSVSATDFYFTSLGKEYTYHYQPKKANEVVNIPLVGEGKLFTIDDLFIGKVLTVNVQAKSVTDSEKISFTVTVVGSDQLTVVLYSLDNPEGWSEKEDKTQSVTGDKMLYQFMPIIVAKGTKPFFYYAAKAFRGDYTARKGSVNTAEDLPTDNVFKGDIYDVKSDNKARYCTDTAPVTWDYLDNIGELILGEYFSDGLHNEEKTKYTDNNTVANETLKNCIWNIPADTSLVDEKGWSIIVKCWDSKGFAVDACGRFMINAGDDIYFNQQIPERADGKTLFARWSSNLNYPQEPKTESWVSELDYVKCNFDSAKIRSIMSVYGSNGTNSGFINQILALKNGVYGTIDLSDKDNVDEIDEWVSKDGNGFTISLTFKSGVHPFNDRTIFQFGVNNEEGELLEGLKVDLEKAYWRIRGVTPIEVNIHQGVLNTIDFVYDVHTEGEEAKVVRLAKIFVNGIIEAALEVSEYSFSSSFNYKMFVGCDANLDNNTDVNIYDLSIFGHCTNDLQNVVNAKNNKILDKKSEESKEDYKQWRNNNFIIPNSETGSTPDNPISELYNAEGYVLHTIDLLSKLVAISPIPVLHIDGKHSLPSARSTGNVYFTRDYYFGNNVSTDDIFEGFDVTFYQDNDSSIKFDNASFAIQGTSSVGYRSKNLEMYMPFIDQVARDRRKLFQPKKEWFPESEFTLKSDVVDSAHANNATIGYWINNYASKIGILDVNPAMEAEAANPPHDIYIDSDGTEYKPDEESKDFANLRVKHTLEGFPFILVANFHDNNEYEILGIFSFNMGRYSYYNMGMKFLKSFTRREFNPETKELGNDSGCPAVISNYNEYGINESIGEIKLSDIYSYEFGTDASENHKEYNLWSQNDISILRHVGEFRYPTENFQEVIWDKLSELFGYTASLEKGGCIVQDKKYKFDVTVGDYVVTQGQYTRETDITNLVNHMSIKNAYGYFSIMNAFGMVDSSGKNMTLRTWDGGKTWWLCFYDMDTALRLTNAGTEEVSTDVYMDYYTNQYHYRYIDPFTGEERETDDFTQIPLYNGSRVKYTEELPEGKQNFRVIYENTSVGHTYDLYNSRLWNLLRDKEFSTFGSFDANWLNLRTNTTKIDVDGEELCLSLSDANNFISLIEHRMGKCGELLYNIDYTIKYLTKFAQKQGDTPTYANISMLHGTRIETIRNWLKEHFYFLDCVFEQKGYSGGNIPYYHRDFSIQWAGPEKGLPELLVRTSAPITLIVETGSVGDEDNIRRFVIPAYKDTQIRFDPIGDSGAKVTTFNAGSLITKLEWINKNGFEMFGDRAKLPALSEFDLSQSTNLDYAQGLPIKFDSVFTYKDEDDNTVSNMRKINLEEVQVKNNPNTTITVQLYDEQNRLSYDKLTDLNIADSCVGTLNLPKVSLKSFKVSGSKIADFKVSDQTFLKTFDIVNCQKLANIELSNWDNLETLTLSSLPNLKTLSINNCPKLSKLQFINSKTLSNIEINLCNALTEINFSNSTSLTDVKLDTLNSLKIVNFSGCYAEGMKISILNTPALEQVNISNTLVETITLSDIDYENLYKFNINGCYNFKGITFGDKGIDKYEVTDEYMLNLSHFKKLNDGNNLGINDIAVKYIKVYDGFKVGYRKFYQNEDIKRIFGNIIVSSNEVFNEATNFSLSIEGEEEYGDKYRTTFDVAENLSDISYTFASTNCNFNDVKIVFACENLNHITDMSSLFTGCKNIVTTEGLDKDFFKNAYNVTHIDNLFGGCENMRGLLAPAIMNKEKLITPGVLQYFGKVKNFNGVFPDTLSVISNITDDEDFSKGLFFGPIGTDGSGNLIELNFTTISSFNCKAYDEGDGSAIHTNGLLKYLKKLVNIENSFCETTIFFDPVKRGSARYCNLFEYNTELKVISDSFKKIMNCSDVIFNLFGGDDWSFEDNTKYSSKITTIVNSFSAKEDDSKTGYSMQQPYIEIDTNFFRKFASNLIAFGVPEDSKYNVPSYSNFYLFNKFFRFNKDDSYYGFPKDIFAGCTKLSKCNALFNSIFAADVTGYRSENISKHVWGTQGETDDDAIEIPSDGMFNDATKLTTLSYMFANMEGFKYKLAPFGFKNMSITDFSYIFSDDKSIRVGMIPYGLFYQGKFENGMIKNIITNINGALSKCKSYSLLPYSSDWVFDDRYKREDGTYEYLLEKDENGEYQWNKYVGDGVNTKIREYYETNKDDLPELIDEFKEGYIDMTLPNTTMYGEFNTLDDSTKSRFATRNFFCPPDMFLYCTNGIVTNITNMFNGCGEYIGNKIIAEDFMQKGVYGTICPYIFEPVSKVTTYDSIFGGCMFILPYKWDVTGTPYTGEDGQRYVEYKGIMYPPTLFDYAENVLSISGLFSSAQIWGGTNVPNEIIKSTMTNISSLFANSYWTWVTSGVDGEETRPTDIENTPQLKSNVFSACKDVYNISSLLYRVNVYNGMYVDINLFTKANNPSVSDCSGFLNMSTNVTGNGPRFWDFPIYKAGGMNCAKAYTDAYGLSNYHEIESQHRDMI